MKKHYISNSKVKPRTKRQIMLEKTIQKILSTKLLNLHKSCITLTDVDISPDCKRCVLLVSSIMLEQKICLKLIETNLYVLQQHLAKNISTKSTPKLFVKWDNSHEKFLQLKHALKNN